MSFPFGILSVETFLSLELTYVTSRWEFETFIMISLKYTDIGELSIHLINTIDILLESKPLNFQLNNFNYSTDITDLK